MNSPARKFVYHVSDRHGIPIFSPRRFWHNTDLTASGILNDGVTVPEGMLISEGFFASEKPWPLFFPPPQVKRIGVIARPRDLTYIETTNCHARTGGTTFIFEQQDEEKLKHNRYSIYSFDIEHFRQIPSHEYLAERPVSPVHETVHENSLSGILEFGISVLFVEDIEPVYEILKQSHVRFYALRHVIGAIRDAQKSQQVRIRDEADVSPFDDIRE